MYFGINNEKDLKKVAKATDKDIINYCKKNGLGKKEKKVLQTVVKLTQKIDTKFLVSSEPLENLPAVKLSNQEMEILKAGYFFGRGYAAAGQKLIDGLAYCNGFMMGLIFGNP